MLQACNTTKTESRHWYISKTLSKNVITVIFKNNILRNTYSGEIPRQVAAFFTRLKPLKLKWNLNGSF